MPQAIRCYCATPPSVSAGGTGTGGDISILNAGSATLRNVQIQALANAGAGGSIRLSVAPGAGDGLVVIEQSAITTNAVAASGGNITLEAGGNQLLLRDSTILASAGAAGTGGNILMNGVGQTIMQRSQVLARADAGNGGTIAINLRDSALFVRDAQSVISADSNAGNDGQVAINAPDTDLNPAVEPQDASLASTPELNANACRSAADATPSTFVRETSGGVSVSPDNYLVSTQPVKSAPLQPELRVAMASAETAIAGCREGAAE